MRKPTYRIPALALALAATAALTWTALARTGAPRTTRQQTPISRAFKPVAKLLGQEPTPQAHNVTLRTARVSKTEDGRVVVLMEADNDLKGSLTMTLERDANGTTITGGFWALVLSYTELTPSEGGDGDGASERLIQKGTLSGSVTGGSLTLDADGNVAAINSAQLTITQGSVAYEGVNAGGGSAQENDLQDAAKSSGSLVLNF
ncbi:MAG: hypothetical protein QOE53_3149 [Pseudonocardiales bacterium]|jgi:hypothetical protein|nr:hypothetical protein [Pseudonocardiales bacterium]